jgi:hypothetical protein
MPGWVREVLDGQYRIGTAAVLTAWLSFDMELALVDMLVAFACGVTVLVTPRFSSFSRTSNHRFRLV